MIAKLSGRLDSVGEDWLVIDVGGVGYLVFCAARTLDQLPEPGTALSLYIDTHVREDHIHLYGFENVEDREWFRALQSVQGVGAKVALAILSSLKAVDLSNAVIAQDKAMLTRAPGVGPKVAGRIVSELKDKVAKMSLAALADSRTLPGSAAVADGGPEGNLAAAVSEAVSALVNLGYRQGEAMSAVQRAAQTAGSEAAVEELIREGLKELAP